MKERRDNWIDRLVYLVFEFRYVISVSIVFLITCLGVYLYTGKEWPLKDVSQVCTGFFIVITLFFTALNYEFAANKMKRDYQAARELLTYTTAAEWHKPPLNEYQKMNIRYERLFRQSVSNRTAAAFEDFLEQPDHLDYKEALKGILNTLETISIAVHQGLIDKNFMKKFYAGIYGIYYVKYSFFIRRQRMTKRNKKLWADFTSLAEEWHEGIKEKLERKELNSTIINP